jgi:hypothetical protein
MKDFLLWVVILCCCVIVEGCTAGRVTIHGKYGDEVVVCVKDCDIIDEQMVCEDRFGKWTVKAPAAEYESDWSMLFDGEAPETVDPCLAFGVEDECP